MALLHSVCMYVPHDTKIHYFLTHRSSAGDLREALNETLNIMHIKFSLNPVWEMNQSCCNHGQSSCNSIRKYSVVRNVSCSHLTTVSRFRWLQTDCHRYDPRSIPEQSMSNLWWTKGSSFQVLSEHVIVPL
jgi:hypothetical protein